MKTSLMVIIGAVVIAAAGTTVYLLTRNDSDTGETNKSSSQSDDFQKMGQYSFGVDVCNEMTKDEVAKTVGKPIVKSEDYSNSGSTGCEYFVDDNSFVIIDVGFMDMANQKTGLEALDRTIKTTDKVKLENFMAYTDKGLNDIYMNIVPGQKYVRVGRSSTGAVDEETLINLAVATEAKIRSFK